MMEKLSVLISADVEELIRAVEVALSPHSAPEARSQAYALCERFKEESPICAQVGFQLASSSLYSSQARHFGLQLVEHSIKFRWKDLHPQEKIAIKDATWRLMTCDPADQLGLEPLYTRDGVARLVVEMVKREWPQQWPTFLQELTGLAGKEGGEFQTELVLLVLLRLTEDVAIFQSVDAVRRRDLYQGLTASMEDIFRLLSGLLSLEVGAYRKNLQLSGGDRKSVELHCRLARSVLTVYHAFLDWVPINHIMAHEGQLLVQLCMLLSEENLRLSAAECLLQVVGRKGSGKERKPLLLLFDRAAIGSMLESAQQASSTPGQDESSSYAFLKRLSEVLVGLGGQLCAVFGKEPEVTLPETFPIYLQALLALSRHPSVSINQISAGPWAVLFKHDRLKVDRDLLEMIPSFLDVAALKAVRPASICSCPFVRLDFDSEEEAIAFYLKYRAELLEGVRQASACAPQVAFDLARHWLTSQLDQGQVATASVASWEAMALLLEAICSRAGPSVAGGVQLLERLLAYAWPDDANVLSELLSCLSALFIFVQLDPARLLKPVLDRILSPLVLEDKTRAVRDLRRHACSLLVKISLQCPAVLLSAFDYLKDGVDRLTPVLGRMELVTLKEALLVISNQLGHVQLQSQFIGQVICSSAEKWNSFGATAFSSVADFMRFAGLLLPEGAGPEQEEAAGQNRAELTACTQLFVAVVRRCKVTEGPHPAASHLAPLLFNIFRLAQVLHQLWEPTARAQLPPAYSKVHDLPESEVGSILAVGGMSHLGVPPQLDKDKELAQPSTAERIQQFLHQLHLNVFTLLGSLGETVGRDFYAQPGLAVAVAGTTCAGMEHVPDYRLRTVVRSFCRPFICSCPADLHGQVLAPFLSHLFPAVLQRLSSRWEATMELSQQQQANREEETDLKEIVRDVMVRLITRDYLDVLRCVLLAAPASSNGGQLSQSPPDDDEMMESTATSAQNAGGGAALPSVSELGRAVLCEPALTGYLMQCLLSALWWPDTGNSLKSTQILLAVVRYWSGLMPGMAGFPDVETVTLCLTHILNGLRLLGQHEGNLNALLHLGVQLYDTFLPAYPEALPAVLIRYAGTLREDVELYRQKTEDSARLAGQPNKHNQKMEKVKRELFRKMTNQVVGQHLADLFRKPVVLTSLPKMGSLRPKPKPDVVAEADLSALFIQE